jgi:virulence-associated protein VagC
MKTKREAEDIPPTAKLVCHGAYQYVLLPKGFEFDGDRVLIDRYRSGVILRPLPADRAKPVKRTGGG